ncbi:MAG: TetR/AcrR family transcriptional regulator [Acidimicrobiia bacterium]
MGSGFLATLDCIGADADAPNCRSDRAVGPLGLLEVSLYYVGRPSKYSQDEMLDAGATLIARDGPGALTIVAVAQHLGAPSGSIYHRFASRDVLAASLWLRAVERFQTAWLDSVGHEDPGEAVRRGARCVLTWSRDHLDDARLLLLFRSRDLIHGDWPAALERDNRRLRAQLDRKMRDLDDRLGAVTPTERRRVRFAAMDIPYGAVRGPLGRGRAPEPELDAMVDDAVVAVINRLPARRTFQ